MSRLRGDLVEHGDWTRRDGPFLTRGFRLRVVHCFWTFDSIEDAQAFLGAAFGERGTVVGAGLKRSRLSYNVAVYHRTRGGIDAPEPVSAAVGVGRASPLPVSGGAACSLRCDAGRAGRCGAGRAARCVALARIA